MLIVEGSDLMGKTELCKKLIEKIQAHGFPIIPQHFGLLENSWDFCEMYLKYMNRRTIMDRFIMSEVVYGNVIREKSRITPEIYRILDSHLRLQGSVTVVIIAEDDWLYRQISERYDKRDEKFSRDQILEVNRGFNDLVHHRGNQWSLKFNCDCDFVYLTTKVQGYVSNNEEFMTRVVEKYLKRQRLIDQLRGDRQWTDI